MCHCTNIVLSLGSTCHKLVNLALTQIFHVNDSNQRIHHCQNGFYTVFLRDSELSTGSHLGSILHHHNFAMNKTINNGLKVSSANSTVNCRNVCYTKSIIAGCTIQIDSPPNFFTSHKVSLQLFL